MKALLVFVEGQADAHYVLRCLGQVAHADYDKRKAKDLPTPFGADAAQGTQNSQGLVLAWNQRAVFDQQFDARTVTASAEDDQPVYQAVVTVPPNAQAPNQPEIVIVIRMGGDRKQAELCKLLERIADAFSSGLRHAVQQIACAFIFDADTPQHFAATAGNCVHLRTQWFQTKFGAYPPLQGVTFPHHASWARNALFPLGLYVWHDQSHQGTLEHLIEPAIKQDAEWAQRIYDTEQLLVAHEQPAHPVYDRHGADRLKARLTIAGQWHIPGSSLAQILRRGDRRTPPVIPDSVFNTPEARAFVHFLLSPPW